MTRSFTVTTDIPAAPGGRWTRQDRLEPTPGRRSYRGIRALSLIQVNSDAAGIAATVADAQVAAFPPFDQFEDVRG